VGGLPSSGVTHAIFDDPTLSTVGLLLISKTTEHTARMKILDSWLFGGMMLAAQCAAAELPRVKAELTFAPNVPPPITRREPAIVEVSLTATHKMLPLTTYADYHFWTFNEHVPGPFIRVRVGDWLEVHISNTDTSGLPHNVDFHAATGPGGGADILVVAPGQEQTAWLRLRTPGLFMYHCSVPPMIDHIANGMYGLILVEPTNGLAHADREFYVMQSEFYTKANPTNTHVLEYSHEQALDERPSFVVFNGTSGSLLFKDALHAATGERLRFFFGNAGPSLISSFHIIGEVMENVYREGGLTDPAAHGLQTTLVTPGAAAIVEITPMIPGTYSFLDHAASHSEKGAMGQLDVARIDAYRSAEAGPPAK
jgi:copper-containing nitrite reductase